MALLACVGMMRVFLLLMRRTSLVDNILERARRHYLLVREQPLPAGLEVHSDWISRGSQADRAILDMSSVQEVVHYAQRHEKSGFNHRKDRADADVPLKYKLLRERFPDFDLASSDLVESPLSRIQTIHWVDGKPYSNIFFWHLNAYLACCRWLCSAPKTVLEIGSGLGELARIYKIQHPTISYILGEY